MEISDGMVHGSFSAGGALLCIISTKLNQQNRIEEKKMKRNPFHDYDQIWSFGRTSLQLPLQTGSKCLNCRIILCTKISDRI